MWQYVGFDEAADQPSVVDAFRGPRGHVHFEFFLSMAINHSVTLESVNGDVQLAASSPDEQAFVAAAEYFGIEYLSRDAFLGTITLLDKHGGGEHVIELLEVFPYESSRKRMSVLVRLPDALLTACGGGCAERLYTKGADAVMLGNARPSPPSPCDASCHPVSTLVCVPRGATFGAL